MPNESFSALVACGLHHRYEVRREIGAGATGAVYLAHDTFEQRDVAIKVAHPQIFSGSDNPDQAIIRKAWLNEVHLAGSLQHPYIVAVYDAGVSPSSAYLVMEYLPGGTLEPFCSPSNLLPVDRLVEIVFKCTRALDYALAVLEAAPPRAIVLSAGDRDSFALAYARYALGRRPDTAVLIESLLQYDWYRANARALYPALRLPDAPEGEWGTTLAAANPDRAVTRAPAP